MTTTTLKKKIKIRFGSMTKFAKLIKVEYYELQKFFAAADKNMTPERQARVDELAKLVAGTESAPVDSDLTPEIRTRISEEIGRLYGGVLEFCKTHPEFNTFSVWQIINGRRKTISTTVKKLLETLNIKLDEAID